MGKKDYKGRLGLTRETLVPLNLDSLDDIVGGNATVSGVSRWTHQCAHSYQIHQCLPR